MNAVDAIIRELQSAYEVAVGVSDTLGPPVVASLLTAVVTVQLTFWYHDRRDKRKALQAFKSELHLNDMETEMMVHDIYSNRDGFEEDSDIRTSIQLATTGYDAMKTSGTLESLPKLANEAIRSHYTSVRLINRKIRQRDDIRYHLAWTHRENAIAEVDGELLEDICSICGPWRLEAVADRLSGNEEVSQRLKEAAESKRGRDLDETPIYGDYDAVEHFIGKEIADLRTLPRWKDITDLRAQF